MRMDRLIMIPVLVLIVLAMCCYRSRTIAGDSEKPGEQVNSAKLEEIGKIMHVHFPDGMKVLGLREERGIDRAIYLRVEFAPEDLKDFLNESPFAEAKLSTTDKSVTDLKEDWW